ncbi:MAG: TadE family type IV pilus minor pilin [Mycobacteriales bacterium]
MSRQRGSVTAETAVALPALVVVLLAGVWGLAAGSLQARCTAAARSAALAGARGERDAHIAARVREAVGSTGRVSLSRSGGALTARVTAANHRIGPLPGWHATGTATAQLEPR